MYEKNTLEINEYECLPNFELKLKFLGNLRKPVTFKSFQCLRTGAAHKNRKCVVQTAQVAWPKNRYRTHRFMIHAILVFRVKFNEEFTRQAVNFSILFHSTLHCALFICSINYFADCVLYAMA